MQKSLNNRQPENILKMTKKNDFVFQMNTLIKFDFGWKKKQANRKFFYHNL